MKKKKPPQYIFNISSIFAMLKSPFTIDLIALNETHLDKVFKSIYRGCEDYKINSKTIKIQNQ